MSKVKVASFGMSIDGFSAGPRQSLDDPLGVGGASLMQWFFPTRTFRHMQGEGGGETGVDDDFAARGFANVGAWILGRNMFGPVRGPWPDESWKGWWGDLPPYHVPVFVLTHYARSPIQMQGGRLSTSLRMASMPLWKRRRGLPAIATYELAAVRTPCANTCGQDWWTRCTSRYLPHCWGRARPCYQGSI